MRLRALFLGCTLVLDACGGGGAGGSSSLPAASSGSHAAGATRNVTFTITIPRKGSAGKRNPATVSPSTLSVTASVNGGAPQVFNVALTAAGCGPGSSGTACTFTVAAPLGADSFELITWDAAGGAGNPLNVGDAAATITTDSNTNVPVTMTTWAVANLNDSGSGSLRQILSGVSNGDTIGFAVRGTITLTTTPLLVSSDITMQGPLFGNPVSIDGHNTMTAIDSVTPNLTINNLTVQHGNAVGSNGGAINAAANNLTLNNDVFQNNQAGNLGGAIYVAGGNVTATGCTFQGNTANGLSSFKGQGGAIATTGGSPSTLTVTQSTFFGNTVASQLSTAGGSTSPDAAGGAIAALTSYTSVTLLNDQFTSNTATESTGTGEARGGAIFSVGGLTIHGSTFNSNQVSGNSSGAGGALNTLSTVTIDNTGASSNPDFDSNSAPSGGAWEINSGSVSASHVTFNSNSANGPTGSGGAIDAASGSGTFANDTFTSNTAINLAGAFEANMSATITNATFNVNSVIGPATPNGAGALDFDNGPSSISNSSFSSNTSTGDGGAMTDYSGVAGNTITNTTFANNTAVKGGGALFDSSGMHITGSSFTGNFSTGTLPGGGAGGAIYAYGTQILTTTIDSNTATEAGGGIVTDGGAITIAQSTISNNHVTGSAATDGGGGIYVNNYSSLSPTLTITNSTITGNTAANANGGGILNSFPTAVTAPLSLALVTLANNSAGVYGGNLYNATQSQITVNDSRRRPQGQGRHPFAGGNPSIVIANSIIVGGSAPSGPDIYAMQNMSSGDYNFIQNPNAGPGAAFIGSNTHGAQPDSTIVLGLLQNNGGLTNTMALTAGDAIHVIPSPSPCNNNVDQRGSPRPSAGNTLCSAGAYEP